MDADDMRAMQRYWEMCTGAFQYTCAREAWLHTCSRESAGGRRVKNEDTSKARKARKERARMLTARRMAEIQAQGGNRKKRR